MVTRCIILIEKETVYENILKTIRRPTQILGLQRVRMKNKIKKRRICVLDTPAFARHSASELSLCKI